MKVLQWRIITLLVFLSLFIAACSSSTNNPKENTENELNAEPEPITLKFLHAHGIDDEGFEKQYKNPIEDKFPYITIERIDTGDLDELIAKGEMPDIYFVENPVHIKQYVERELALDLSDLIEKHGFDLSRIQPNILTEHRTFSNGNLYTIPLSLGLTTLHYNKDIFDKFGVEYPTDHMTWEEVISLAEKVTGEREGVQYHGLQPAFPSILYDQRGITFVDPDTDESRIMNDEFREEFVKVLQTMEQIASIPGNIPKEDSDAFLLEWGEQFISERNVAMLPLWQLIEWYSSDETFNFDIVTYPEWEDLPGITRPSKAFSLGVTATSEYPDDAFKVITYLLSDEKQIEWAKAGQASALEDPAINEHLLEDLIQERPHVGDLNIEALTKQTPSAGSDRYSEYEHLAGGIYDTMVRELIEKDKDINTVLREADEALTILLKDEKTKK
ncbi:extracellular solute-binding protein [Lederbergia sp. NSJ-179]|uniref:ABC transporter substrate-binding protein n=1 Tax=Lederbergia sp. NSJ-179 TaxID=2931402 RepID=UPI001FCF8E61|nr:extracellular solute-binding protein [Lederbergia sp. NSJ-179]MCJ7841651.1 extracellular solute-binding protein [Lederbergia sp. NSJ-179]